MDYPAPCVEHAMIESGLQVNGKWKAEWEQHR